MHIMIDDQKPIEVTPITDITDEFNEPTTLLSFNDAHQILTLWQDLAIGRRGFRYGRDESDDEPSVIIIAEATQHGLNLDEVEPFWDGSMEHNAYALDDLDAVLPLKVVD